VEAIVALSFLFSADSPLSCQPKSRLFIFDSVAVAGLGKGDFHRESRSEGGQGRWGRIMVPTGQIARAFYTIR
jgi:hypothetical protein